MPPPQHYHYKTGNRQISPTTFIPDRDQIDVVFTNDYNANGSDRNLYVDYVTVGATTVQAKGAMILDYGGGLTAFDGANVVSGAERMGPSGAFRFVLGAGAAAYGYDKNGNISYKLTPGQADVFAHDAAGRMRQVKRNGAVIAQYGYDGDGNRVQSIVNSVTTKFVGGYPSINSGQASSGAARQVQW